MRPINELSNGEKAIYLHQLFPGEIRGFLAGMELHASNALKVAEKIKTNWASTQISADNWLQLAEQVLQKINERRNDLVASSELFAQELFTGYMGIFTLDYLPQHCDICAYRFRYALQFFFDVKPLGKLPFLEDEL